MNNNLHRFNDTLKSTHLHDKIEASKTYRKFGFVEVVIMKRLIAMVLCLLFVISLRRNFKVSYLETLRHNASKISSLALSISEFSTESKYMSVVFSEAMPCGIGGEM